MYIQSGLQKPTARSVRPQQPSLAVLDSGRLPERSTSCRSKILPSRHHLMTTSSSHAVTLLRRALS